MTASKMTSLLRSMLQKKLLTQVSAGTNPFIAIEPIACVKQKKIDIVALCEWALNRTKACNLLNIRVDFNLSFLVNLRGRFSTGGAV